MTTEAQPRRKATCCASDIRTHFVRWWRLNYLTSDVPSCRILGSVLAESPYPRRKSGSMVYRNVAFRPDEA